MCQWHTKSPFPADTKTACTSGNAPGGYHRLVEPRLTDAIVDCFRTSLDSDFIIRTGNANERSTVVLVGVQKDSFDRCQLKY